MNLCHLGWRYSLKSHRLSNQVPRFKQEKSLLSCWWGFTKTPEAMYAIAEAFGCLSMVERKPLLLKTLNTSKSNLKIWAGSNLKASFLSFSFHSTRRRCARCQGREETDGPIQLWCLWTTVRTSMPRLAMVSKVMGLRGETSHDMKKSVAVTLQHRSFFPANRDLYIKPKQVIMQRSTDHGGGAQFPTNQLQHSSCICGSGGISEDVIERLLGTRGRRNQLEIMPPRNVREVPLMTVQ